MSSLYRVFASLVLTAVTISPAAFAQQSHGVNTAAMDRSVRPGDDFYKFANGTYVAKTAIPADRSGVSVFSILGDRALLHVTAIVTDPTLDKASSGSDGRKIADLYKAYMDEAGI